MFVCIALLNNLTLKSEGQKDGTTIYHRFQNDGNGNFHWNGSTNGKKASGVDRSDVSKIPPEILRK